MLRQDPDFLLGGEIRDLESDHVAVSAAGSCQALLSTLHARDAVGVVTALRNYGVKNWEISAQRLVSRFCQGCRTAAETTESQRDAFKVDGAVAPAFLWRPVGCEACGGTGHDGRVGVFEIWRLGAEARALIQHGADEPALRRHALASGMRPLIVDALDKVAAGLTTLSEMQPLHRRWEGASPELDTEKTPSFPAH